MPDEFPDLFEGFAVRRFVSLREYDNFRESLVERQVSFKTRVVARRNRPRQFLVLLVPACR